MKIKIAIISLLILLFATGTEQKNLNVTQILTAAWFAVSKRK